MLVASETRAWAFDRELRKVRFSLNLVRFFPGTRVRSLSAANYWQDGLLYLLVGVGESEHRRVVAGTGMSGARASTCDPTCVSEAACR